MAQRKRPLRACHTEVGGSYVAGSIDVFVVIGYYYNLTRGALA